MDVFIVHLDTSASDVFGAVNDGTVMQHTAAGVSAHERAVMVHCSPDYRKR